MRAWLLAGPALAAGLVLCLLQLDTGAGRLLLGATGVTLLALLGALLRARAGRRALMGDGRRASRRGHVPARRQRTRT